MLTPIKFAGCDGALANSSCTEVENWRKANNGYIGYSFLFDCVIASCCSYSQQLFKPTILHRYGQQIQTTAGISKSKSTEDQLSRRCMKGSSHDVDGGKALDANFHVMVIVSVTSVTSADIAQGYTNQTVEEEFVSPRISSRRNRSAARDPLLIYLRIRASTSMDKENRAGDAKNEQPEKVIKKKLDKDQKILDNDGFKLSNNHLTGTISGPMIARMMNLQSVHPAEFQNYNEEPNQDSIPVIDMSNFDDPNVANAICATASKWGFFQIVNH
ncbi:oxoglutarate/iron-dependent dioxygenase [Artemisia annua]|uniref:Oxoglutarate/iron-dependent dioxygenase n=1 Tax=Artemisia annua TaxID=35608 RepID=A0A2U1KNW9_ARTAN|nr:oxoglutarate/iron-dependent dioxygenase [Artemisia annua]